MRSFYFMLEGAISGLFGVLIGLLMINFVLPIWAISIGALACLGLFVLVDKRIVGNDIKRAALVEYRKPITKILELIQKIRRRSNEIVNSHKRKIDDLGLLKSKDRLLKYLNNELDDAISCVIHDKELTQWVKQYIDLGNMLDNHHVTPNDLSINESMIAAEMGILFLDIARRIEKLVGGGDIHGITPLLVVNYAVLTMLSNSVFNQIRRCITASHVIVNSKLMMLYLVGVCQPMT